MTLKYIVLILAFNSICFGEFSVQNYIKQIQKENFNPRLYYMVEDSNEIISKRLVDYNDINEKPENIAVIVHGWIEQLNWPHNMAVDIYRNTDPNNWLICWYDWKFEALKITPTLAAEYGRDVCSKDLANSILSLKNNFKHFHFIGHSAGSWVVSGAVRKLEKNSEIDLHLTFLDAYVPQGWDVNDLGLRSDRLKGDYYSEHYFTKDITWFTTEKIVANAVNFDLTEIDPGINDHLFPVYWYHGTIIDKYPKHWFYEHFDLISGNDGINYGFDLSLESGLDGWKNTQNLVGSSEIKIIK